MPHCCDANCSCHDNLCDAVWVRWLRDGPAMPDSAYRGVVWRPIDPAMPYNCGEDGPATPYYFASEVTKMPYGCGTEGAVTPDSGFQRMPYGCGEECPATPDSDVQLRRRMPCDARFSFRSNRDAVRLRGRMPCDARFSFRSNPGAVLAAGKMTLRRQIQLPN